MMPLGIEPPTVRLVALPESASTNCVTRGYVVPAGILVECWLEWESGTLREAM